jgi:hypothetical protein
MSSSEVKPLYCQNAPTFDLYFTLQNSTASTSAYIQYCAVVFFTFL